MEQAQLKNIIEGALLAAGRPLDVNHLLELFEEDAKPEREEIRAALEEVAVDCAGRGFELKKVNSGYRFQVRQELSPWVSRLWDEKPQKYSRALLETLSLIAYRQPITRGDIEEIRGVSVSSHIMKTLLEREWVRVVGHRDVPGRPSLYATTRHFLDHFNLSSLEELPPLSELRDLDELDPEMELAIEPVEAEASSEQAESADATATDEVAALESELESEEDESAGVEADADSYDAQNEETESEELAAEPEEQEPERDEFVEETAEQLPTEDEINDTDDDSVEHREPPVDPA